MDNNSQSVEFDFCSGIYGFQAESMAVFSDQVRDYLQKEGCRVNEIKVTIPASVTNKLVIFVLGVFARYFYYPAKVRCLKRTNTVFVADSANAGIYNLLPRSSRFVIFLHGLAYQKESESLNIQVDVKDRLIRLMSRIFKRRGLLGADLILANSQRGKDDFLEFSKGKFLNEIIVCPLGISNAFKRQSADKIRSSLGVANTDKIILSVAAPDLRKNMEALVSALALLENEVTNWMWVHVGGLHSRVSKAMPAELKKHLIPVSHVPHEEMPLYYSMADVFVLPTVYDTFGWPPLEAAACGCPVVVSDIPPLNINLRDIANLVDPHSPDQIAKAIGTALIAPESAEKLHAKSNLVRGRFSWQATVRTIVAAIRALKSAVDIRA